VIREESMEPPGHLPVTLFLSGDVMTGRGVDQILPHPSAPGIFEPCVRDAREYVALAELACGPIPRPVTPRYIWGDALEALARATPDARIINLETSVTVQDEYWPAKGINYRMHPDNIACLGAARIDVCGLANNHVLDYGYAGLEETLDTVTAAGIKTAGAGRDLAEARRPAIVDLPDSRRVLVFAFGTRSSGIPPAWGATPDRAGVDYLEDLSSSTADEILQRVGRIKRTGDIAVASIHWGSNWGYEAPRSHVGFAHRLIDGGIDVVHGHSSHHPRPIEVYRRKLVLYGCGDCIDDYEGITDLGECQAFRQDLVLLYLPTLDPASGELLELRMEPMQIRNMRLNRASPAEAAWLRDMVERVSADFGTALGLGSDLALLTAPSPPPSSRDECSTRTASSPAAPPPPRSCRPAARSLRPGARDIPARGSACPSAD
jgi:poly-gamma-glutamate capsule biosynthesis protein CapA/YwtB (metallophosphatase superfamily)